MAKMVLWCALIGTHGTVTPPLKNVRKRRFRKTKIKKVLFAVSGCTHRVDVQLWFVQMIESPEVEKEVKRLLRADTFAANVCILELAAKRDIHIPRFIGVASAISAAIIVWAT